MNANKININKIKISIIFVLFLYSNRKIILIVPLFDNPLVSIIIPVHNKFLFTFHCISSILNCIDIVPYEIILANDVSTDETQFIDKYIKNINIINNDKKYNFLLNCNRASKYAKGKYIIFLNNDTQVNKEWLISLFKLIESDNNIGMVGSKLIYPNGKLQEAGGIVYNNAECANYGHGDNPNLPQYNYVKEVDYISGASIMIRKSIFQKLRGFDERFCPAYYEDTDLAFQVRKYGYKVMYQPKSVVIHYEGISNGKDLRSSIKKYQNINKLKFKDKWKTELKLQKESKNLILARDRAYNKTKILVIESHVPTYDKDAGSRCTFMYLNLFSEIGFQVTFFGIDFKKLEPYTSMLQQKGIEILYGKVFKNNLEIWLSKNLKNFKYVYFQRADVTKQYIDLIMKYFSGKIIYFAHDLSYIRFYREYLVTNEKQYLTLSRKYEKIENEIIPKCDIIHVVGDYELNILKQKYENKTIRNIPLYIFDNQLINIEKDFSKRKDIIFVGGFMHYPNVDAVLWFSKEIYPKIIETFPDIIWYIVGGKANNKIKKLESKNIKIKGILSDNELHILYQKCRIAIAPLRIGAGVKGKIIEAAYNQIPIVTTSIGAEGLDNSTGVFIIEDNAKKLSEIICKLYKDFKKLKEMSDASIKFIEKYFSKQRAKDVIFKDIK